MHELISPFRDWQNIFGSRFIAQVFVFGCLFILALLFET